MRIVIYTHRTAIHRRGPSRPVQMAIRELQPGPEYSVLDYGCGRGADVRHFERLGLETSGYDPYPGFGYSEAPEGLYKLVTLVYVLNIIPTREERLEALQRAREHLLADGMMLIATRSPQDIEAQATGGNWIPYEDGYVTRASTFQRGMDRAEVLEMAGEVGLELHHLDPLLKSDSRMTVVLLAAAGVVN